MFSFVGVLFVSFAEDDEGGGDDQRELKITDFC